MVSPALQRLHRDELRGQRHGRLQLPVGRVVLGKVGRAAVQHDAGAHPVGARLAGVAQHGGTVGDGALARQVARGALEGLELVGDAARAVGVAEVGHERDLVDLRQRVEPGPGGAEALGREAQAVHAGVHLEEHALRLERLVRGEHVDLLVAVHAVPQVQARAQLQVAGVEHALQQQHRAAPAEGANALGLGQVEQREAVRTSKTLIDPLDAMAIGIGFHHGPHAGIEGRAAHPLEVVAQGAGMDSGEDGARHGNSAKGRRRRRPRFSIFGNGVEHRGDA
jgi:hypothetical protein